jgi:8-oxo-dGTP pyrophosphatase MutT (NUDIX family)
MPNPKRGKTKDGQPMHYAVGALIKKGGKYLLIDRKKPPFGFASIAGHIDEGENEIESLKREVEEESGLKIENFKLLFEEELDWNWCREGINSHYWYLFDCQVSGDIKQNELETKSIAWYAPNEIKKLKLEPVWQYWFKKLKII